MEKSANQQFKEYFKGEYIAHGGMQSFDEFSADNKKRMFKEWINRQSMAGPLNFNEDDTLNQSIQATIADLNKSGGLQTSLSTEYYLGLPKKFWIVAGVGALVVGIFIFYEIKIAKKA